MVAGRCKGCTVRQLAAFILELCVIGSFVFGCIGLGFQKFYSQNGEALSGRLVAYVRYDYQDFEYSYKLHIKGETYGNYSNTMQYSDAYKTFCVDETIQYDFCKDLKHIGSNSEAQFLLWCSAAAFLFMWVVGALGFFWLCCSGGTKCCNNNNNNKCNCCQCNCKCNSNTTANRKCSLCLYSIQFIFCLASLIGYLLFLLIFNINFNKAKPGLDEVIVQLYPYTLDRIDWNKIEIGSSNYYCGVGLICCFIALSMAFIGLIKSCTCCGCGNNSYDYQTAKGEALTPGYTIVVNE